MSEIAFSIVVRELSDDQMFETFEIEGSRGGGEANGVPYVDFLVETDMPEHTLDASIHALKEMGIEPVRVETDLVNISGIAQRTGATRQAVRMWAEGERREAFPMPFSAAMRVWLWSDVYAWLRANKKQILDEYSAEPLSPELIECYNGHLADGDGPYATPGQKRDATQEILVVREEFLTALGFLTAQQVQADVLPQWSREVAKKSGAQRFDRKATHSLLASSYDWSNK
ncbi:hypothetical protein [Demequina zhanjiangensis]|uniref:Uncharacterized protein n=1 Tax=Demequina zhanjiangensis TaxID=3051659 RepID=A0ABT8G3X6_9MICO|nr:hypothetical protein [Demequina sp. SYSU T00b26]MDN4473722.1 hypothetical protein [Demequina sp. SYSU T00b26]